MSAPSDVLAGQVRERAELEEKEQQDKMLEYLQALVDREKERLTLELQFLQIREQLQQLGAAAAGGDRRGVGSGGAARGGVIVSGGPKARAATAILCSGRGLRTSITRAQRKSTRALGVLSKRS